MTLTLSATWIIWIVAAVAEVVNAGYWRHEANKQHGYFAGIGEEIMGMFLTLCILIAALVAQLVVAYV